MQKYFSHFPKDDVIYVVAAEAIGKMSKVLNESDIEVFGRFKGKDGFNGCYYVNPMFPDSAHPMYAAATVQANKGNNTKYQYK